MYNVSYKLVFILFLWVLSSLKIAAFSELNIAVNGQ